MSRRLEEQATVLDFAEPSVTVEACCSKNRRKDVQPLSGNVAADMKWFCAGKPRSKPLWPGNWPEVGSDVLRHNLARVGIPYSDENGNVYDFHALRRQFITDMVASGVHPKDAQALARHSIITLTMDRYAHVRQADLRSALDKLPGPKGDETAGAQNETRLIIFPPCTVAVQARPSPPDERRPLGQNAALHPRAASGALYAPCTRRGISCPRMGARGPTERAGFITRPASQNPYFGLSCTLLSPTVPCCLQMPRVGLEPTTR